MPRNTPLLLAGTLSVAIGCTQENGAYDRFNHAADGSATASGTQTSSAEEESTSTLTSTSTSATSLADSDTLGDGTRGDETRGDEGHDAGEESTGDPELCAIPQASPFEVTVVGAQQPVCDQIVTWTGTVVAATHDTLTLVACNPDEGGLGCTCQADEVHTFTFTGLPVDLAKTVFGSPQACVEITVASAAADHGCDTQWVVMKAAPILATPHLLAAANERAPELTSPPIELHEPLCADAVLCDGHPAGPYWLRVVVSGTAYPFKPQEPALNVPMAVHGVESDYDLRALRAEVDAIRCEERVGWVAIGTEVGR